MRYEIDIRERLIDNTIHLVAEGGFEKATTRAIASGSPDLLPEVRMNESYIYRLFGGKTQLYDTAFSRLDNQLFTSLHNCVGQIGDMTDDPKDSYTLSFCGSGGFFWAMRTLADVISVTTIPYISRTVPAQHTTTCFRVF